MLKKKYRLLNEKDFQKIWKRGRSFYTKILGFKVFKNDLDLSRFGIVVGNKISKKATIRNKIKRQLREIIGKKIEEIAPGYDLVITALPEILGKKHGELETDVALGLKNLNLLKP